MTDILDSCSQAASDQPDRSADVDTNSDSDVRDRSAALAELVQLRRRVDELEARLGDHGGQSPPATAGQHGDAAVAPVGSRRTMLKLAGAAAAGVAASTLATGRAAAANGDPVLVGNSHTGTAGTTLINTANGVTVFNVASGSGVAISALTGADTAIFASSSGDPVGVIRGIAGGTNGVGVSGQGQIGIRGEAGQDAGSGVVGVVRPSTGTGTGVWGDASVGVGSGVGVFGVSLSGTGVSGRSESGSAVRGVSDESTGVSGVSGGGGFGVAGESVGNAGVFGSTASGFTNGVYGTGPGVAILGSSSGSGTNAIGVRGTGARYGVQVIGALGFQAVGIMPPTSGTHQNSDVQRDGNDGSLWACVESGSPGVWRKLIGAGSAGSFHAIDPFRAYDSRLGAYAVSGPLNSGASRLLGVVDKHDVVTGALVLDNVVPFGATAVSYNVTAIQPTGVRGFLAVMPGTATTYSVSTVNWSAAGQNIANASVTSIDASGQIKVFAGGLPGSVHVVVDITGYYL